MFDGGEPLDPSVKDEFPVRPELAPDADILLRVEGASKKFCRALKQSLWYGLRDVSREIVGRDRLASRLRTDEYWALKDVSFELRRGESLAVIGRNGAGKSTLIRLLSGGLRLDEGSIRARGRVGAVTALGSGFNPLQSGRENVYNAAAVIGLGEAQLERLFDGIVEFAELGEFIDSPVQSYSTGMKARLGYAIAAHLRPDVLLVDEVLSVGDAAFQRKCQRNLREYVVSGGSLVVVSHDAYALQCICSRCLLIEHGRVTFDGPIVEGLDRYYDSLRIRGPGRPDPASPPRVQAREPSTEETVIIDEITIRPLEGDSLRTNEGAQVVISYRSARPIQRITCGFSIASGDQLVQIASALSGFGEPRSLASGSGQLRCTIRRLPFHTGTYILKGGIADESGIPLATFGWKDAPTRFSVASDASVVGNIHSLHGDLVSIDVIWEA